MATRVRQDRAITIRNLFDALLQKDCRIIFDAHEFTGVLTDVAIQKTTGFKLAPEKRMGDDGKAYSPALIKLTFDNRNDLVFVDDDADWTVTAYGVTITVGQTAVTVESVRP